jgi:signal transduction histidine kinase
MSPLNRERDRISLNPVSELKHWVEEHSVQCANCIKSDMRWDELTQRLDQLSDLIDVSKAVAAQLDLDPLLQQIVNTATRLVDAEMGGLLVFDETEQVVQFFKVSGWNHAVQGLPTAQGTLGLPYRQRLPLRVDDVRDHPQALGFPDRHPEVGPFLSVPLMRKEDALGVLFVGNAPGGSTFGLDDEELLLAFAAQATIAIENARLYAQAEELARLKERQRIAQALHDTVAQMLFSIGLEVQWLASHLDPDPEIRQKLEVVRRLASRSSDELRSAIFALRSQYVARCDALVELLQEQIDEFQTQSGIEATLIVPPQCPSLPPLICDAIYRIVHEALSNVRKHAQARGVVVSLTCGDDSVTVVVQDNGVGLVEGGFEEAGEGALHFGVATMRQLTRSAQGDFSITNNDDQGVMVRARFPVLGAMVS